MIRRYLPALAAGLTTLAVVAAEAQPLGTFTWQLQPFCNVVTVNVTQQGTVYTMDGYDDQCGAARRAPIVGLGTPNPDGTIGLGWNVVTTPGGRGLQVDARITLPSANGSWSDSAGNAGTLALGASTGGAARPIPSSAAAVPGAFSLLSDGSFLARGAANVGPIPVSGSGTRMMWYAAKGAFRAGYVSGAKWDDPSVGILSTALGIDTVASGIYSTAFGAGTSASAAFSSALGRNTTASASGSTAMGDNTTASGTMSTAMGSGTIATGQVSTALGLETTASGKASTAMGEAGSASGIASTSMGYQASANGTASTAIGHSTTASGYASVAMGRSSVASGDYSIAMGLLSTASGGNSTAIGTSVMAAGQGSVVLGVRATATSTANGSFVFGDRSTGMSGAIVTSSAPNEFLVRATGGVYFYTNASLTAGAKLDPGGSGWSIVSDVHMKEHFRDVADSEVLAAVARMPVREWSYKTQDASIRHMGPTAQDFHAAFGLGESDVRINTIDADGVALAAVKALEARTRALPDEARALRVLVADLARDNNELRERLARLEALIEKR